MLQGIFYSYVDILRLLTHIFLLLLYISIGSMIDGPWSYRIAYICLITPAYTALLLTFGTLAGRREFFMNMTKKMWGRFIPGLKKK